MGTGFEGLFGRVYSFYMERPRLSRLIARTVWDAEIAPYYASMAAIRQVPDGGVVVDVPCGSGVAFRALPRGKRVRYIAIDLSPVMVERARRRAAALGLSQVELVEGDAQALAVEDGSVDLLLSYWGLHCFADPAAAVVEIARCLAPEGRAVGSMICRGQGRRQRLLVRPGRGLFGPTGTVADFEHWIEDAGLILETLTTSEPFAYFSARTGGGGRSRGRRERR